MLVSGIQQSDSVIPMCAYIYKIYWYILTYMSTYIQFYFWFIFFSFIVLVFCLKKFLPIQSWEYMSPVCTSKCFKVLFLYLLIENIFGMVLSGEKVQIIFHRVN